MSKLIRTGIVVCRVVLKLCGCVSHSYYQYRHQRLLPATLHYAIINVLSQTNEHLVIVNVDIPAHTSRKPGEIKSDSVLTRLPTIMHI